MVVRVRCVHDLGKGIEHTCQAATFVSEAKFRVTYQVVHYTHALLHDLLQLPPVQ